MNNEINPITELIDYLLEKTSLSENDILLIQQFGKHKHVDKGTFLHEQGMIANSTFFVAKGLFRLFKRDAKGEEFNLQFSAEGYWINDYESYITGEPSENYLEALEESEVVAFKKDDLEYVLQQSPVIKNLVDKLTEKNTLQNKSRLMHQLTDAPSKRYEDFITHFPDLHNRLPLYMIASYLGISRKTLGRIRASS